MGRIDGALNLASFAESHALDGIRRQENVGRFGGKMALGRTQEAKPFFGDFEETVGNDRITIRTELGPDDAGCLAASILRLPAATTTTVLGLTATATTAPLAMILMTPMTTTLSKVTGASFSAKAF